MCHREIYRQLSLTNMREIFPLTSKLRTIMQLIGTRQQGFFRAGEFSWNESTLINILSTIHQKKASRENKWDIYTWKDTISLSFLKIRKLFNDFQTVQVRSRPPKDLYPSPIPHPTSYMWSLLLCHRIVYSFEFKGDLGLKWVYLQSTLFIQSICMFNMHVLINKS